MTEELREAADELQKTLRWVRSLNVLPFVGLIPATLAGPRPLLVVPGIVWFVAVFTYGFWFSLRTGRQLVRFRRAFAQASGRPFDEPAAPPSIFSWQVSRLVGYGMGPDARALLATTGRSQGWEVVVFAAAFFGMFALVAQASNT